MPELQHTIAHSATLSGRGLFSGQPVTVVLRPAPVNHGIVFVRTDQERAQVPAVIAHVRKSGERRTALRCGEATIETCEHCLSAIAGLDIDNLIIEINASELPGLDGSAKPYVEALLAAQIQSSEEPRRRLVIHEPVVVRKDDAMLAAVPSEEPGMQVVYDLDYGTNGAIPRQVGIFDTRQGSYAKEIAPARTFALEAEAQALVAAGLGTHLTPMDVVVLGRDGPIGGNAYPLSR